MKVKVKKMNILVTKIQVLVKKEEKWYDILSAYHHYSHIIINFVNALNFVCVRYSGFI